MITDKAKILERWAENLDSVLSRPYAINDDAIDRLLQAPFGGTLDAVPTFEEIGKAIHLVTCGKAHGADSIFAEVYKEAGTALTEKLHQLFWETTRPVTSIVKFPCCPSQARLRPEFYSTASLHISLLFIAGKAQARVPLNCLTAYLPVVHRRQGSGLSSTQPPHCISPERSPTREIVWRPERTNDMMFTSRQVHEKCQEQNADLYSTYVDLTNAFDSVNRDGLWRIRA